MHRKADYSPYAYDQNGKKYVHVKVVMSALACAIDGLTTYHLRGDRRPFLLLDDAIAWVETEIENTVDDKVEHAKYKTMLQHLTRRAQDKIMV